MTIALDTPPPQPSPPRRKLRRASTHIRELERVLEQHFATKWYSRELTRDTNGQGTLSLTVTGPPEDFSEIVGDAVHNLRTALDLVAVEAVRHNGGNTTDVYFPFAHDAANLQERIKRSKFDRASSTDQDIVRKFAPYGGEGGHHFLRSLHDLDIQDKHRASISNGALLTYPVKSVKTDSAANLTGSAEGKQEPEIDPTESPTIKFTFPPDSVLAGEEVVSALWRLHESVTDVVDALSKNND